MFSTSLVALSSLVSIALLHYGPTPAGAVSIVDASAASSHFAARGHDSIAKRRRTTPTRSLRKRCKARQPPPSPSPAPPAPKDDNKGDDNKNNGQNNKNQAVSSNGNFAKFGLAWSGNSDQLKQFAQEGKTVVYYNWNAQGPAPPSGGFMYAPMLWGPGGDKEDAFNKAVWAMNPLPEYVLMANEPELDNGSGLSSGMSPGDAVSQYWRIMEPLRQKGVKIGTPAVTSGPAGEQWMEDFMNQCSGCVFEIMALHWYDIDHQNAIDHFSGYYNKYKLNIWITEMTFNNFNGGNQLSVAEVKVQATAFNAWAMSTGYINIVMYFGYQQDMVNVSPALKLFTSNNKPNDLGGMILGQLSS